METKERDDGTAQDSNNTQRSPLFGETSANTRWRSTKDEAAKKRRERVDSSVLNGHTCTEALETEHIIIIGTYWQD